jgi:hypothetical protein
MRTARAWIVRVHSEDLSHEAEMFRRQIVDTVAALECGDHAAVGDVTAAHVGMLFRRMMARTERSRGRSDAPSSGRGRGGG